VHPAGSSLIVFSRNRSGIDGQLGSGNADVRFRFEVNVELAGYVIDVSIAHKGAIFTYIRHD